MWRREERLGSWLAGRQSPAEPSFVRRLIERLRPRVGLFPISVKTGHLSIETRTLEQEDGLAFETCVQDGLTSITARAGDSGVGRWINGFSGRVGAIELLAAAQAQDLKLPTRREARIKQGNLIIQACNRSLSTNIAIDSAIHDLGCFINALPKIIIPKGLFTERMQVGSKLSHMEILPYKRTSLKIAELSASECSSFIREAEAMKRVPADRIELLAVFRHIPIELISKIRYLADHAIVLYTICRGPRRTHTRVHDLAVIQDKVSREIFFIPHRSRFRPVHLN
jgi:hypothetical protein